MSDVFDLKRGNSPLIVSMPHSGENLGPYANRMTESAQRNSDCDWHLLTLYSFLFDFGVTTLKANYSRYVIDLNRDPLGKSLYPGQNVTELCPTTTFEEDPVYLAGEEPDAAEVEGRVETYWRPYHEALEQEIDRVRDEFGYALLWDAHSIRSHVPRFFEGQLPDLNFGTNDNKTCDAELSSMVMTAAGQIKGYTAVLNGRFKGGYITRKYGCPDANVHAVQLELSQITYMDENYPFTYQPVKAAVIRKVIESAVGTMQEWKPTKLVK